NEMTHIGPGIERLHKAGDVRPAGGAPAKVVHLGPHPDLKRLRWNRLNVAHHIAPSGLALDQLRRHPGKGRDAHSEHHEVEIVRYPQGLAGGAPLLPWRLEGAALTLQDTAIHELVIIGTRRPTGNFMDFNQGPVFAAAFNARLNVELQ